MAVKENARPIRSMDLMTYHVWVWQVIGMWPPPFTKSSSAALFLYRVYAFFFFGTFYVIFPSSLLSNLIFVSNLSGVVDTVLVSSTVTLAAVKGVCIMSKLQKIRNVFEVIEHLDDYVTTDEQRVFIGISMKNSRRLVIMMSSCYYCGVTTGLVLSLVGSEMNLMWPAWYPGIPWRTETKWFCIVLVYQFIASGLAAFMDSSADLYGVAMNNLLGAHLESLSLRLQGIGNRAVDLDKSDKVVNEKWEYELKECVRYYSVCIRWILIKCDG